MSACTDFVEHIWKPGSCKNCFCPRNFHQLQSPSLDQGGGSGLVHDLNGIRAKAENIALEDDSIISLPYTKPTIAVKPTMINSDSSDVWADGNLSADIPQVMINKGCGEFYKLTFVVTFALEQSGCLLWQDSIRWLLLVLGRINERFCRQSPGILVLVSNVESGCVILGYFPRH